MPPPAFWKRLGIVATVVAVGLPLFAQNPAGPPQPPRTGMIVGQVVDGVTGQPIPEASVRLTMSRNQPAVHGRVIADSEGRFFFADLPGGDVALQASRDGYISGGYAQRRPDSDGAWLPLRENERRTDIVLRVWKYGVLGGTVVDEAGEPVVGISVRALRRDIVAGRLQFGGQSFTVPTGTTDDRGVFRLPRIAPGTYVVVVPSMHAVVPQSVMTGMDSRALQLLLFWSGIYQVTQLGDPRTQQVGDAALMTLPTVHVPPQSAPDGRMSMYRTTFYPSATSASDGTPITVGPGDERTDLAIALRPAPAARISGRLVTPDGSIPPPMGIKLLGESATDITTASTPSSTAEVGFETVVGISDATGRFTLVGVPAGEYTIKQADNFLVRSVREGGVGYWTNQRLTVGTNDLNDVVVSLHPAIQLRGRVVWQRANGDPAPPGNAAMSLVTPFGEPGGAAAEQIKGELQIVAAAGRYLAVPTALGPSGVWFVQSVVLDGRDVTDRAFDLEVGAQSMTVTFTDRPLRVSGTVKDARGAVSQTARVLAFPVDQQRWTGYGRSARFIRSVSISPAGTYTFDYLPPGDYHVIAIEDADSEGWNDPRRLRVLASRAEKLTVTAGDVPRTLDLAVRSVK